MTGRTQGTDVPTDQSSALPPQLTRPLTGPSAALARALNAVQHPENISLHPHRRSSRHLCVRLAKPGTNTEACDSRALYSLCAPPAQGTASRNGSFSPSTLRAARTIVSIAPGHRAGSMAVVRADQSTNCGGSSLHSIIGPAASYGC